MAVVMAESLKEKLERIKKREWWPVANLADILGTSKKYIYRKIENEKFETVDNMGIMKISSDSVVKFFEDRCK